jgi:serine/threonine protein kinase
MAAPAEFVGKRVGRFTITSHLASGGMAELFIARQEAVGGFEKHLVLKMLQERYASNPRVLQMFLDEARLAAKLNHQNIVHVYDVDRADGIHYIAMEYIHGETVTDIIRRSIAAGSFLPLEHAVQIVADVAAGLAYAHERREIDGKVTRIVHRDVSPSNVLVTYEGVTKIVDFGIARVQDQIREESGMRPGKMSYMSPEQVRGEISDHRADIYALGIVLYEVTVGRRLFRGPPEVVMKRILEEQVPPPTYIRRGYPPALELIIMKALEKKPADRQQSAAELQHELLEFMEETGLKSGPRRLARYMKDLFAVDTTSDVSAVTNVSGQAAGPGRGALGKGGAVPSGRPGAVPSSATQQKEEEDEEDEDLDFDRRAPLMMRVEPRPEERADWESGPAAVPIPAAPPSASGPIGSGSGTAASRGAGGAGGAVGSVGSVGSNIGPNKGLAAPPARAAAGPRQSGAFKIPPAAYPRSPGSLAAAVLSNGAPKVPAATATTPAVATTSGASSPPNASVQVARSPADSGAVPAGGVIPNAPVAAGPAVAAEPAVSAGLPSGRVILVIVALIAAAIVVFIATK